MTVSLIYKRTQNRILEFCFLSKKTFSNDEYTIDVLLLIDKNRKKSLLIFYPPILHKISLFEANSCMYK